MYNKNMKKKILLIPLLFTSFVVTGCNNAGGSGGGGSDPKTPTKHIVTLTLDNCFYYFNVDHLYTTYQGYKLYYGYTFNGAISFGLYEGSLTTKFDEDTQTVNFTASGFATSQYTATVYSPSGPTITKVQGTVTYWM